MCVRVRTFVLHPVRVCVCDTSCERVWNVNNNKPTPTQPLHTPTILSNPVTKKNRNRRYAAIVHRRRLEQRKS